MVCIAQINITSVYISEEKKGGKVYRVARTFVPNIKHKCKILWIPVKSLHSFYPVWITIAVPTSVDVKNGRIVADRETMYRIAASLGDLCTYAFSDELCDEARGYTEALKLQSCRKIVVVEPWSGEKVELNTCELIEGVEYMAKGFTFKWVLDYKPKKLEKTSIEVFPESFRTYINELCRDEGEAEVYRSRTGKTVVVVCGESTYIFKKL